MRLKVLTIPDVAASQLCCGCGACAYISPDEVEMVDVLDHGRRPRIVGGGGGMGGVPSDPRTLEAMRACPGVALEHTFDEKAPGLIQELIAGWGPVLEVWEGYAADPEIRFAGSSGGAATALALFALRHGRAKGILHTAPGEIAYLNRTAFSTTREELMGATGSRYAPASPCDGLANIEGADGPCVFIGKPCDVAGANKAAALRPGLAKNLALTVGIFCAGTPSTRGTFELMRRLGITDPSEAASVRYRGNGWPGNATVVTHNGQTREMTYQESWREVLTKHMQWRCRICPDHTGEFADISVGDPWYKPVRPGDPGQSLVLARTERGREFLHAAMDAGYLSLQGLETRLLPASQMALLRTRGNVWARLWTLRALGAPSPRFRRIPMFRHWMRELTLKQKAQSVAGTASRVLRRGLKKPVALVAFEPPPAARIPTFTPAPAVGAQSGAV